MKNKVFRFILVLIILSVIVLGIKFLNNNQKVDYYFNDIKDEQENSYENLKEDISIETIEKQDGYYSKIYTRRDEKNNIIWSYETKGEIPTQVDCIGTIEITEDRVYLYEFEKIIVLNKENGKMIWNQGDDTVGRYTSWYLDKDYNLYIIGETGILYIMDKDGEIRGKIENKSLREEMIGEGFNFNFINENELLLEGIQRSIFINLKDYTIKEVLDIEFSEEDFIIIKKTDGIDNIIWKYKAEGYIINAADIIDNKIFIKESEKVIALNVETGKVLWINTDYKKGNYPIYCFDSKGSVYLCDCDEQNLLIIDNSGKTVHKIDNFDISFDEYEGIKTLELRNNEKELIMKCDSFSVDYKGFILERTAIIINLEDYSITYENIDQ